MTFTFINAGLSGTTAKEGLNRLERDVIRFRPDLTVVCFGLNDVGKGSEGLWEYKSSLGEIFAALLKSESDVVFMTPNHMNDRVDCKITDPYIRLIAEKTMSLQTGGIMDQYMYAALETAKEMGVKVCDWYGQWNRLKAAGVDTTGLLANLINHPVRELHRLFASELFHTLFFSEKESDSA